MTIWMMNWMSCWGNEEGEIWTGLMLSYMEDWAKVCFAQKGKQFAAEVCVSMKKTRRNRLGSLGLLGFEPNKLHAYILRATSVRAGRQYDEVSPPTPATALADSTRDLE